MYYITTRVVGYTSQVYWIAVRRVTTTFTRVFLSTRGLSHKHLSRVYPRHLEGSPILTALIAPLKV